MGGNRPSVLVTGLIIGVLAILVGTLATILSDGARFGPRSTVDAQLPTLTPAITQVGVVAPTDTEAAAPWDTPTLQVDTTPLPTATTPTFPTAGPSQPGTPAPAGETGVATPQVSPTELPPTPSPAPTTVTAPTSQPPETVSPGQTPTAETPPPVAPTEAPAVATASAILVTVSIPVGLNVRGAPSTIAEVLAVLPDGTVVPATQRTADGLWIRVSIPEQSGQGWVSANFVTARGDLNTLPVVVQ